MTLNSALFAHLLQVLVWNVEVGFLTLGFPQALKPKALTTPHYTLGFGVGFRG